MVHSRMPLPSLLSLLGVLLMLSPELLLEVAGKILFPAVTDKDVRNALTFTVEQYNKDTGVGTNYFKVLHFLQVVKEVAVSLDYHFTLLLIQTSCEKKAGEIKTYENIQRCPLLPGNQKIEGKFLEVSLLSHLPATLSLASPMVHSRLPLPSLLGLFGALLMFPPELLLGNRNDSATLPFTNPGVQKTLAFAVEQYNQDRENSTHYFKTLRVLMTQAQDRTSVKYSFLTQLVETKCTKRASPKLSYKDIQNCERLPRNPEEPACFFKVIQGLGKMELEATSCI